ITSYTGLVTAGVKADLGKDPVAPPRHYASIAVSHNALAVQSPCRDKRIPVGGIDIKRTGNNHKEHDTHLDDYNKQVGVGSFFNATKENVCDDGTDDD